MSFLWDLIKNGAVLSKRDPLTGMVSISAGGVKLIGGFDVSALKTTALHKPYGTSDASFNKSSGLSSAVITTCVKTVVDAPFTAFRLVSTNRGNQAITGIKALFSVTETMATGSSGDLAQTVIGGTTYSALAGATDQNGQRAVTFGGASSFDHAASTATAPDLKITDWQPIKSIPRADGGSGYAYFRKVYRKGDTNGNWAFTALINNPAPSAANRQRPVVCSNVFSDGVGTISRTYSLTNTADDVSVEFKFDRPVFSVWGAGDSTMACIGLVADKISSWLFRACADVSTAETPVIHANFGAAGMTSADFITNIRSYLEAGVTPPSMLFVSLSINEIGSSPDVRKSETALKTISDAADLCQKYGIPYLALTPMMPNENISSSVLDEIRKQINTDARSMCSNFGVGVLDLSSLGDGAAKELWVPSYKFDAFHPNEVAIEDVLTQKASAMIRSVI